MRTNRLIQIISLVLVVFFISMPLSMPTAEAGWASCTPYKEKADKYMHFVDSFYGMLKTTGNPIWQTRALRYYALVVKYQHKYTECVDDMGEPVVIRTKYNEDNDITAPSIPAPTANTYKFKEWTCIEEGNNNHCFRVRPRAMQFKLKSGQRITMMTAINYQEWKDYNPYQVSSKYRKSNWYIGQDTSGCITAINLYNLDEYRYCGKQTVKKLAPFFATVVSAGAIVTVTTTTYMSLAGT